MQMCFVSLALSAEVTLVVALWYISRRSAGLAMKLLASLVGSAAGASIGLAAQCAYFLYAADEGIEPDAHFLIVWLLAGILGFAAAILIRPGQLSGSVPSFVLAFLCLAYAWHFDSEVWIAAAVALGITAAALWALTRSLAQTWVTASTPASG